MMQDTIRLRQILGVVGAVSGLALWGLWKILETGVVTERAALTLGAFVAATLGAHMAVSGTLTQRQAGSRALLVGAVTSLLFTLAALPYDLVSSTPPISVGFIIILWHLSLPFVICQGLGRGLRHYPTLYAEAWKLFERLVAAWIFAGLTWAVIYLADLVLGLVGVQILDLITEIEPLAPMITGGALGLGLAVMLEIGGQVVPALLQRLLRLLLPVLLAVVVLFLVILPFRNFDQVFGTLSAGAIFLLLVAIMASMVTAATGPQDGQQVQPRLMQLAARVMAGLMILPALLAIWALWLRVQQYGWTPERLAAALLMGIAVTSAALYLFAALRPVWHDGIRRGNVIVALSGMVLTAVFVGVLPTEQISARTLIARYEAGLIPTDKLDIYVLERWGRPGAEALATLRVKADAGDTALAAVLDGQFVAPDPDRIDLLRADLKALLPVQPATATATRDALLDLASPDQIQSWASLCQPVGAPPAVPCGLVVADLLTESTGEEVLFLQKDGYGVVLNAFAFGPDGLVSHSVTAGSLLGYVYSEPPADLFAQMMTTPLTLIPAPMNMIDIGGGVLVLPNDLP